MAEACLGNAGWRLAAVLIHCCLGLPGDGVGLNYPYGLSNRRLRNKQTEDPTHGSKQIAGYPHGKTFSVPSVV